MTYSIVARDPETGEFGIAVASRFFACGSLVPNVCATAAFASQAFVSPLWGIEGLKRLADGERPDAILADLVARDAGQASRQAHMIAPDGTVAQHTGADCVPWAGHAKAENVSVAGNMLAGPEVVADTLAAWLDSADLPFAERFLTAMEAGERAGGDKRGKQAAGLLIHSGQPYPSLDLRVDDHNDPLAELRRLMAVTEERYLIFRTAMPTVENFSGMVDRTPLDKAIAANEKERAEKGIVSQSLATPLT
ncbi:DUF1028 domain-containing protein [Aestuariicoccus sp. MJ-SS9]|uniref:DUF1028 domain-containing protein n=1 Tax=Aestuariicoccus sp. MJ-SS9 TaxID=3079855 RepID=UPI00290EFD09|nr:DUF1028 domain-containing protein [Aestuariicoccus sp. MJ-SS9]MDU8913488.1 DUF1028 domain-containing protein [Aestuariicoccus sp. MJ-SS9]